ncbi:hypothetical protein E5288_WYG002823 [Bos mutus]|uniref:Small ribosomal subunit protein uS5 n=1 Tax=Bos mutus TaxID=72004 RepID=A0A6B0SAK1_9CETA|nr:hypothetical protein [Bos mutus]
MQSPMGRLLMMQRSRKGKPAYCWEKTTTPNGQEPDDAGTCSCIPNDRRHQRHWHLSTPVPKKLLLMAGIYDCYTSARGCTATLDNFAKATFDAISKTYSYLTPDLWKETAFTKIPYQEFTDHLVKTHTRVSMQRTQAPAVATT